MIGAFAPERFPVVPSRITATLHPMPQTGSLRNSTVQGYISTGLDPRTQIGSLGYRLQIFRASGHRNLCWARHALRRRDGARQCGLVRLRKLNSFFMEGDTPSEVGYGRESRENMPSRALPHMARSGLPRHPYSSRPFRPTHSSSHRVSRQDCSVAVLPHNSCFWLSFRASEARKSVRKSSCVQTEAYSCSRNVSYPDLAGPEPD